MLHRKNDGKLHSIDVPKGAAPTQSVFGKQRRASVGDETRIDTLISQDLSENIAVNGKSATLRKFFKNRLSSQNVLD